VLTPELTPNFIHFFKWFSEWLHSTSADPSWCSDMLGVCMSSAFSQFVCFFVNRQVFQISWNVEILFQ